MTTAAYTGCGQYKQWLAYPGNALCTHNDLHIFEFHFRCTITCMFKKSTTQRQQQIANGLCSALHGSTKAAGLSVICVNNLKELCQHIQ